MELTPIKRGNELQIILEGELDQHNALYVRERMDKLLEDESITNLDLNMKRVTFMDSSGLGVVLGRYKTIVKRNGRLTISDSNGHVDKIFKLAGVYALLEQM